MNDDAIFGGFFDLGDDYSTLVTVGFVEVGELLERVVADNVGVENEEWGVIFGEGLFGKFEGTGRAEGLGFNGEFNVDVVFFFVLERGKGERLRGEVESSGHTSFRAFSMTSGR